MVIIIINFKLNFIYFCFPVPLSTILQLLKLPGSTTEWGKSYQTIKDSVVGQGGVADLVWFLVQFVGAPGDQGEWKGVIETVADKVVIFQNMLKKD